MIDRVVTEPGGEETFKPSADPSVSSRGERPSTRPAENATS